MGSSKYFNFPIEASFDLQTKTFNLLPVQYPKIFHQAYYGKLLDVGRAVNEHLHVFNFNIDPNLYLYNTITDSLSVVGGRSIYQKTEAKP